MGNIQAGTGILKITRKHAFLCLIIFLNILRYGYINFVIIFHMVIRKKRIAGFTLVELIVVITILVVLGTIWFLSTQSYIASSRDSSRVVTVKNLSKGLELFFIKTSSYPMPENISGSGDISWVSLVNVWVIWDTISRGISFSSTPTDPLFKTQYAYGVDYNRKRYQIGTMDENSSAYSNPLLWTAYASAPYKAYVLWNYDWFLRYRQGDYYWLANIPSLLFSNTWSVELLSTGTYYVVDKEENMPFHLDSFIDSDKIPWDEIVKKVFTSASTLTWVNITDIVTGAKTTGEIFTGALLSSFTRQADVSGSDVGWLAFLDSVIKGNGSIAPSTEGNISYLSCSYSWETIAHGNTIALYNENAISASAGYDCNDRKTERLCDNWNLSWSSDYQFLTCVKWTISNCSANPGFIYNWHTYSTPVLLHWSGVANLTSSSIGENYGQFRYTLDNVECNDGTLININENASPVLQNCDTWYSISWNSCIPNACSVRPSYAHALFTDWSPTIAGQVWTQSTDSWVSCRYACSEWWGGSDCSSLVCNPWEIEDAWVCKDPDFWWVVASLHLNGWSTDVKWQTFTPTSVQASNASYKFWSAVYFPGSSRISSSQVVPAIWALATNKFTFETWVRPSSFSAWNGYGTVLMSQYGPVANSGRWKIYLVWSAWWSYNLAFGYTTGTATETFVKTVSTGALNAWSHVAITIDATTPSSTTVKLFINWVWETFTAQNLGAQTAVYSPNEIGGWTYGLNDFVWYMDDFRITKWVLRYASNFTPPIAPFADQWVFACNVWETNYAWTCKDDSYASVIALLRMNGGITDEKWHVFTDTNTSNNTTMSPFGSSRYFPLPAYLTCSAQMISDIWAMATNKYTFETWVHPLSFTSWNSYYTNIMAQYAAVANSGRWKLYLVGSAAWTYNLGFWYTTSDSTENNIKTIWIGTLNSWSHIAITIDATTPNSTTIKLFINWVGETFTAQNFSSQTVTYGVNRIWGWIAYLNNFDWYMDDFRITKWILRYTGNFTPPRQGLSNQQ